MNETDQRVLERVGYNGAELAQIIEAAGGDYDVDALIRTGYLRLRPERITETTGPRVAGDEYITWYVLTPLGAAAIGLDPNVLDSQ